MSRNRLLIRRIAAVGAAFGIAALLSGCVIEPIGPYYYHPHHEWGYY